MFSYCCLSLTLLSYHLFAHFFRIGLSFLLNSSLAFHHITHSLPPSRPYPVLFTYYALSPARNKHTYLSFASVHSKKTIPFNPKIKNQTRPFSHINLIRRHQKEEEKKNPIPITSYQASSKTLLPSKRPLIRMEMRMMTQASTPSHKGWVCRFLGYQA